MLVAHSPVLRRDLSTAVQFWSRSLVVVVAYHVGSMSVLKGGLTVLRRTRSGQAAAVCAVQIRVCLRSGLILAAIWQEVEMMSLHLQVALPERRW